MRMPAPEPDIDASIGPRHSPWKPLNAFRHLQKIDTVQELKPFNRFPSTSLRYAQDRRSG
jgi:hypothetical protein